MNNEDTVYTGAILHTPSAFDYLMKEVAFSTPPFDWNVGYDVEAELGFAIPPKDQGTSGSCGGQAWSYYGGVIEAFMNKTGYDEKSAKFIYSQTFVTGGGSDGRVNSTLVVNKGFGKEALTSSYDAGNPPDEAFMERPQDITPEAFSVAMGELAASFALGSLDIDSIAQYARDNHGTVIGLAGSNNGTWRGEFPLVPSPTDTLWYHWLYVGKAKMINGIKYVAVLNSWGASTGVNGWQWIPEAYFDGAHVWASWNIVPKIPTPVTPFVFATPLTYGTTSPDVTQLQLKLQTLGYFPKNVNATGYFGNITAQSLKAWQVANGIMDFANTTDLTQIRFGAESIAKINTL